MDLLITLAAILLIFWFIGIIRPVQVGKFVHVLLVVAIVLILVRVITHTY